MICEVFTTRTPPKRADTPATVGFLPVNHAMNAANGQRESSSSGNLVQMSLGAPEHQAEHPEGIICPGQHRQGKDCFSSWSCHSAKTLSESLLPHQQKSSFFPREEDTTLCPKLGRSKLRGPTQLLGGTARDEPASKIFLF